MDHGMAAADACRLIPVVFGAPHDGRASPRQRFQHDQFLVGVIDDRRRHDTPGMARRVSGSPPHRHRPARPAGSHRIKRSRRVVHIFRLLPTGDNDPRRFFLLHPLGFLHHLGHGFFHGV